MRSPTTEIQMTKIQRVIDDITQRIRTGEYEVGSKLPSAAQMRVTYGVSQMTIRTALERLKGAGLVTTAPGSGAYVVRKPE